MTYIICLLFIGSIILMCLYQLQRLSTDEKSGNSKKLLTTLSMNDLKIHSRKIDDCNLERQYCYTNSDCFNRCHFSNKGIFQCITGVCKLIVTEKKDKANKDCDLKKGMAPFLIGVPELATVEAICKPVDLGIVYSSYGKEKIIQNKMCAGQEVKSGLNYMEEWPIPENCKCGDNKSPIIIPATENVRQYVQCVDNDKRKWIYEESNLIYHSEKDNTKDKVGDIYKT